MVSRETTAEAWDGGPPVLTASWTGFTAVLEAFDRQGFPPVISSSALAVTGPVAARVHQTLALLGLLGPDGGQTPSLRRLVKGDYTVLLGPLQSLYPELIQAIQDGLPPDQVFGLFSQFAPSQDSENTFRSLLLRILKEAGIASAQMYERRRRNTRLPTVTSPPFRSAPRSSPTIADQLAERQANIYLGGLERAVAEDEMERVDHYHRLLSDVHALLRNDSARVDKAEVKEPRN